MMRGMRWDRLLRRLVVGLAFAALLFVWGWLNARGIFFRDALAYWRPDFADLYGGRQVGEPSTYLYSPAFAQLMWLPGFLPWPLFAAVWSALTLVALVWMTGPVLAALLVLIPWSPVVDEVSTGNIHIFLAAGIVIGFRYPGAWAFHLLTKVTPGVGVLWFAGRREWRPLLIAVGTTAIVAIVSFAASPQAWFEWIDTLARSRDIPVPADIAAIPGPLWLRTVVAAAVAVAAGVGGWKWLLPVTVTLALPVPWSSGLSVLVAMIPLGREAVRVRRESPSTAAVNPERSLP
jgi:hypothetical protein